MVMAVKSGVDMSALTPQILFAIVVADRVFDYHNAPLVVTSLCDGRHKTDSFHYTGRAVDIRLPSRYHGDDTKLDQIVTERLTDALGENFDVVLESDHIHIEYDPPQQKEKHT
jgi:hypothetical protein